MKAEKRKEIPEEGHPFLFGLMPGEEKGNPWFGGTIPAEQCEGEHQGYHHHYSVSKIHCSCVLLRAWSKAL